MASTASRWIEYMRLDQIKSDPGNVKTHAALELQRSIAEHGFGESVLLDERTMRLLAGHGRRDATLALHSAGRPVPRDVEVDDDGAWKIPVDRGYSTRDDEHARAYLIVSNQLTIKGGYDERALLEQLHDLDEIGMLPLTGFSANELEMLERIVDPPPPPDDRPPPERGDKKPGYVTCPNCGEEFEK